MIPPKAPSKAVVLPSISLLPSTDPCFLHAIDDVTLIASGLIAATDTALLTIAVPSDRWQDGLSLVAWNQRLAASTILSRALAETPAFGPALDALCTATNALFARLETWGWTDIDAPELCLVTDGIGIILSTSRPPVQAHCGWLLDLARSESGATTVRPLDTHGAWSLIAAQADALH